jgi:hypothetical protein
VVGVPCHRFLILDTGAVAEQEHASGADEVMLPAGRMTQGVIRRGDRLFRPAGPWSGAVHEYLDHLVSAGFAGAPLVLGVEDGREILTYLDGDVPADPQWQPGRGHRLPDYARTDAALAGAARLVRELHVAAEGFRPVNTGYRYHPCPPRPGQIITHGDLGPWNTVYRDGLPVAFIDFDSAGPADPLTDLAGAAWAFVPLAPAGQLREAGFDPLPGMPGRLRLFVDSYGLDDRAAILPALQRSELVKAECVQQWPLTAAEAADTLEETARRLRWLDSVLADLERAL